MTKILFVCLGNICRSPIAEGIAKKMAKEQNLNYEIDSAGMSSFHKGATPCENSQIIASNNGVDISTQRSRPFMHKDVKYYDYIVGMDSMNIADLKGRGVKNPIKMGDFGYDGENVPDPYLYSGFLGFEKVYEMIEKSMKDFIEEIEKKS